MAFSPIRLDLPAGRALVIRPVAPDDADALGAFFAELSTGDRQRRFFSVLQPPARVLERMATVAERGGFGLVATLDPPAGGTPIVAAADYARIDDGDGELSLTVAEHWRGWLGAYLLDALTDAAAEAGIPNLEADILVTNREMLALAHARGAVTVGQSDPTIVRVVFGTGSRTPSWPGPHDRFRLLVEGHGGCWQDLGARQVLVCPRPSPHDPGCPALAAGTPCPLAAGADAIVVSHRAEPETAAALIEAHGRLHPDVLLLASVPPA